MTKKINLWDNSLTDSERELIQEAEFSTFTMGKEWVKSLSIEEVAFIEKFRALRLEDDENGHTIMLPPVFSLYTLADSMFKTHSPDIFLEYDEGRADFCRNFADGACEQLDSE